MKRKFCISEKCLLKILKYKRFTVQELMKHNSCSLKDAFEIIKYLVKNNALTDGGDGVFHLIADESTLGDLFDLNVSAPEKKSQKPSRKQPEEEEYPEEFDQLFAMIKKVKESASYSDEPSLKLDYVYLVNDSREFLKVNYELSDTPLKLVKRLLVSEPMDAIENVWKNVGDIDGLFDGTEKAEDHIECFRMSVKLSFFDEEFSDDIPLDVNLTEYLLASEYFYEGDRPRFLVRFK